MSELDSTAPDNGEPGGARYLNEHITLLAAQLDGSDDARIDNLDLQWLLLLAARLYVRRREEGHEVLPTPEGEVLTATEASVVALGLLDSANLDVFELTLWRHWGRI